MVYCFDLDNTLCDTIDGKYEESTPIQHMIDKVNHLYDEGYKIIIYTARGMTRHNKDVEAVYNAFYDLTLNQIQTMGIKHHELILGKPSYDFFIDDKNVMIETIEKTIKPKIGFIAGAFDVIHPGYIHMFIDIKKKCDYLMVALHKDPSLERGKKKPILLVGERQLILESIKYIDEVVLYESEEDLINLLKESNVGVRFLGDDYKDVEYNGKVLGIPVDFIDRSHGWSTTKFKNKIKNG